VGDDGEDDEDDLGGEGDQGVDDYLCAKLHLVDLAGSERAKRTKAEGQRMKVRAAAARGPAVDAPCQSQAGKVHRAPSCVWWTCSA